MSRPMKQRRICCLPKRNRFGPLDSRKKQSETVVMTLDEYETIRLIDFEQLNQEECAKRMNVARTTVQGIYSEARSKLADSLVNGKMILIHGGKYEMCDGRDVKCRDRSSCRKKQLL